MVEEILLIQFIKRPFLKKDCYATGSYGTENNHYFWNQNLKDLHLLDHKLDYTWHTCVETDLFKNKIENFRNWKKNKLKINMLLVEF